MWQDFTVISTENLDLGQVPRIVSWLDLWNLSVDQWAWSSWRAWSLFFAFLSLFQKLKNSYISRTFKQWLLQHPRFSPPIGTLPTWGITGTLGRPTATTGSFPWLRWWHRLAPPSNLDYLDKLSSMHSGVPLIMTAWKLLQCAWSFKAPILTPKIKPAWYCNRSISLY